MAFGDQDLLPAVFNHVFPILGLMPQNNLENSAKIQTELFRLLEILNGFLKTKTFLVGERISLADISVSFNLILLMERGLLKQDRDKFDYLMRWFNTIVNQKNVKDVIGKIQLCDKLETLPKTEPTSTSGGFNLLPNDLIFFRLVSNLFQGFSCFFDIFFHSHIFCLICFLHNIIGLVLFC